MVAFILVLEFFFFLVFWLPWVFVAGRIFSSCGEQGLQVGSVLVA